MKKMAASRQQIEEVLSGAAQQAQDKEDAFRVKKRTLDLLPDAQNNIHKLQVSGGFLQLNEACTEMSLVLKSRL